MEETAFREKVRKQLWFLNRKEKQLLEHTLNKIMLHLIMQNRNL